MSEADNPKFRLRVRYAKRGRLKYLGHLEVLHTIERIVRRAQLPYAVTQGFSPHMKTGFSSALPVGTASNCEWFDLFMMDEVPVEQAMERLKAASPDDLAPLEAAYIDVRAAALTAFLTRLEYRVTFALDEGIPLTCEELRRAIDGIRTLHGLDYMRGRKSKRLDLDHTLLDYDLSESDGLFTLVLDTHADNDGSMRPELLMASLDKVLAGHSLIDGDVVVSCGVLKLDVIARYDIQRTAQMGQNDAGERVYPI